VKILKQKIGTALFEFIVNKANRKEEKMADPTFPANNPQMGDDFAAVYEATAHRITGPVSNTALDLVGVGPGTRILDIAAPVPGR
jgi:hypothetical protein